MNLTDLITNLRTLVNDSTASNRIYNETPTGPIDGVNTQYRLQQQNVVAASLYVTTPTSFRSQTGFTLNAADGLLTMNTAPAAGSSLIVDYAHTWFDDAAMTIFLQNGARMILQGGSDPTTVPDGLVQALLAYGAYYFWTRRASEYANEYNASGGMGLQEQVATVTQNFLALATQAKKNGDSFREDFYEGQGGSVDPASAVVSYGIDPMSPMR